MVMQTLIDLFEFNSTELPASPKPVALVASYDGRATLVDIDIDWEETFHGNKANDNGRTEESGTFMMRGARVWLSEE